MKKNILLLSLISALISSSLLSLETKEQFIVKQDRSRRNRTASQLKQEIAESLVDLVQYESKNIELSAKIQQELFVRTQELLEKDKKAFFEKATQKQLEQYLSKTKEYIAAAEQEIANKQQKLIFLRSNSQQDNLQKDSQKNSQKNIQKDAQISKEIPKEKEQEKTEQKSEVKIQNKSTEQAIKR